MFCADPGVSPEQRQSLAATLPIGFTGSLGLRDAVGLNQERTGNALQGLRLLEGWTAAAKARLVHRQHLLMIEELERFERQRAAEDAETRSAGGSEGAEEAPGGRRPGRAVRHGRPARPADPSLAFSLAAAEIATLFRIPEGTAMALVQESDELCTRCPETLARLEAGAISLAQARTILDQTKSLVNPMAGGASEAVTGDPHTAGDDEATGADGQLFPSDAAAALEEELLQLAPDLTNAQLTRKARRLRERNHPQSIPVRHRAAFEERRVWFQPQPDGMGHLTAYLPADKGQQIYGALTGAARGEQAQGDPRGLDQLRADILASLLLHTPEPWIGPPESAAGLTDSDLQDAPNLQDRGTSGVNGGGNGSNPADLPPLPPGTVAEIMVLIDAVTLFGADDAPAELAGYGPITAEAARRLARAACRWTGLVRDSSTGQILGVGRRRKVPAGLRRWLQARDQTCRFPGCSAGTARAEVDHTIPWAEGGPTEHWNLAHLCKKHHLFKTLGHWKARQVSPGVLEWVSPLGRRHTTQPELTLSPQNTVRDRYAPDRPTFKRVPLSVMFRTEPDTEGGEDAPF